ncbi:MAG: helix-turn-helix transcriptional regulator [Oscillospiraceae bacterium]|nr:helix-turn-helix transcriptional regulator [Oscillospiraceae bacterium]
MAQEYEIVNHPRLRNLNVFLVRLVSRTSHIHQELELGLILEGKTRLVTGSEALPLERGGMYLINPMEAHEFLADGDGALILSIQISPRFLDAFSEDQPRSRFLGSPRLRDHIPEGDARYRVLWALCVELAYSYLGSQPEQGCQCFGLAAQLMALLKRQLPSGPEPEENARQSDRILSILDHIEANYTHKLLLEDIARREGLSMPYLSHLFKDTLGVSFQEYLKEKRFEHACNLIATTQRKILDISISSGFSDVRYLTKLFQERYSCTPREFRSHRAAPARKDDRAPESAQFFFTREDALRLLSPIRRQMIEEAGRIPITALWQ